MRLLYGPHYQLLGLWTGDQHTRTYGEYLAAKLGLPEYILYRTTCRQFIGTALQIADFDYLVGFYQKTALIRIAPRSRRHTGYVSALVRRVQPLHTTTQIVDYVCSSAYHLCA